MGSAEVLAGELPWAIIQGDARSQLAALPAGCVQTVVTSPPYFGLRAYGTAPQEWGDGWRGELGLEPTPAMFVAHLVDVFREVKRVLRQDGTCWLNIGDSYASTAPGTTNAPQPKGNPDHPEQWANARPRLSGLLKSKDLMLVPERLAIALQDDGWYVRSRIAWCKTSPMPESVMDRPTSAWEHVWLLTKSAKYFYDADAVRTPVADSTIARSLQNDGPPVWNGDRERGYPGAPQTMDPARFADPDRTGANLRNFWVLGPEPFAGAHFACMPTELARRCILAGTSERGCCPTCGAPWARVVDKHRKIGASQMSPKLMEARNGGGWTGSNALVEVETIGWQPTCACPAHEPIPCVVLDPFSGAGTTVLTANRHGRRAIGIELNPDYVAIAERRITDDAPLVANEPPRPVPVQNGFW